jgi:hypothetical protein
MILATLAAPGLCCCEMTRFSARFVSLLRNEIAKPARSHRSCCHQDVPVKDSQPANLPDAPSCPCQRTGQEALALVLPEYEGARQLARDLNAQALDLLDCDTSSGVVTSSTGLTLVASDLPTPVLTGRDILSSLHILRC